MPTSPAKAEVQPGNASGLDLSAFDTPYEVNPAFKRIVEMRARLEGDNAAARAAEEAKALLPKRPAAKRFSTDYGVEWGRRQQQPDGHPWVLIDRERYDHLTKRHHDLELGVDAIFDDGEGRVGIQAAGVGERAVHWQRFLDRGGQEKARKRRIKVIYMEFKKGNKTPVKEEVWSERP